MNTNTTNHAAQKRYIANIDRAQTAIQMIDAAVSEMYCTEGVNWGHVGSAADLASSLEEIRDRLYHLGEYAE